MSWRSKASEKAIATGDRRPVARRDAAEGPAPDGLTRAQARAQARCAPLTPAEFKARRRVAEQGFVSLRGLLTHTGETRARSDAQER